MTSLRWELLDFALVASASLRLRYGAMTNFSIVDVGKNGA